MDNNLSNIGNLFALSHDPVVCVDNGYISYMNSPALSLFGRDKIGMPECSLIPDHLLKVVSENFVASAKIQDKLVTVSRSTFMGQRLYSFILPVPEDEERAIHAVSSTMRELANGIKTTSDLITTYSMQHENPILCQYSAILKHYSAKMKRLVNNYALFSAFKQGHQILSPEMASISQICREICDEVEKFTLPHNITLSFHAKEDVITSVDVALLSQMLLNLISNSLNNIDEHGHINLILESSSSHFTLTIEDNGNGIPSDVLIDVFKSYTKSIDLSSGTFTAGLGLSVADAVAKLHGGTLIIESNTQRGTRVIAQIPKVTDSKLMSPKAEYIIPMKESIMTDLSTWLDWEDYLIHEEAKSSQ